MLLVKILVNQPIYITEYVIGQKFHAKAWIFNVKWILNDKNEAIIIRKENHLKKNY